MASNNVMNRLKKFTTEERAELKEKFADVSKLIILTIKYNVLFYYFQIQIM